MSNKPQRIDYICPKCGSDNVTIEAFAIWSFDRQRWVLDDTLLDNACCPDCGASFELDEALIDV